MEKFKFPELPDFDRRIDPTPENRMLGSGDDVFLENDVPR